jgi:ribosomal protein L11 methyltransferase
MADSWKVTLPCSRTEAENLDRDFHEFFHLEEPPVILTQELFAFDDSRWEMAAYFEGEPGASTLAILKSMIPSAASVVPLIEQLPDEDWVTLSQQGLQPVHAGRFYVYSSAHADTIPTNCKAFKIEASQAFGTGGHETTTGCLFMLDWLKKRGQRYNHIADIGTGTGLLAFAATHLWPSANITASDIDPVSIRITVGNAEDNDVALGHRLGEVALCTASGTDHVLIQHRAPYDLLIANILAGPLIELAPAFADITADGGHLILAGLIEPQVALVQRAYRKAGFTALRKRDNGDWPCLLLVKRRRYGWRRSERAKLRTSQKDGDFGTW